MRVSVRLWPALFGRYEVGRVLVVAPELWVIRDRSGLNVATLGGAGKPREGAKAPAPAPAAATGDPSLGAAAAVLVSALEVEDGRLTWLDRTTSPPTELTVTQPARVWKDED